MVARIRLIKRTTIYRGPMIRLVGIQGHDTSAVLT